MYHSIKKSHAGFSLLELLIYIAIVAIITVTLSGIFVSLVWGRGKVEGEQVVNANLQTASALLSQDIRSASQILTPESVGATSTRLMLLVGTSTISYDISGGRLQRQVGASAPEFVFDTAVEIPTSTNALVFTRSENVTGVFVPPKVVTSVSFSVTLRYRGSGGSGNYIQTKQSTVYLR